MSEQIIETKECKNCSAQFNITDKDLEFYEKISPTFAGKKFKIPSPTFCPDCRSQRRLAFRNEGKFYKRKCDATGKAIISMFSPEKEIKVYDQDVWWSDRWDPMTYGRDFDFSRPFFEQFKELLNEVPFLTLINDYLGSENSEYINFSGKAKNCYLITENGNNENCYYSQIIYSSKNCIDNTSIYESENCYGSVNINKCYKVNYSINCLNCQESYFLNNCNNCRNCYMCFNLNNQEYCIENKKVSKEEFMGFVANKKLGNYHNLQNEIEYFNRTKLKYPIKYYEGHNNQNSIGDYIYNCKNTKYGFDVNGNENCAFVYQFFGSNYCYDCFSWGQDVGFDGSNLCYEDIGVGSSANKVMFSYLCRELVNDVYYSYCCRRSKNLFACVGLRHKEYCILNKQYTKDEYEKLVAKIIEHMQSTGEWGEFFPITASPLAYNETVAMDYYPMKKEEALTKGYSWQDIDYPINIPNGIETIEDRDLPEINELSNQSEKQKDILSKAIICKTSGKPFRIIKPELDFYLRYNIPLPRLHPNQRHLIRLAKRNPRKLFDRNCDKCGIALQSSYAPDRPEIVYCEKCYNEEVY